MKPYHIVTLTVLAFLITACTPKTITLNNGQLSISNPKETLPSHDGNESMDDNKSISVTIGENNSIALSSDKCEGIVLTRADYQNSLEVIKNLVGINKQRKELFQKAMLGDTKSLEKLIGKNKPKRRTKRRVKKRTPKMPKPSFSMKEYNKLPAHKQNLLLNGYIMDLIETYEKR